MMIVTLIYFKDNIMINKTQDNTWTFSDFSELLMVGLDRDDKVTILNEGFIEVDSLDGSMYDDGGDEKKLLVKNDNGIIYFETLPEDYNYWNGTENCKKQGCLGYIENLLNNLKNKNCEHNIEPKNSNDYIEVFLWHIDYIREEYPYLLSLKEKKNTYFKN